MTNQTSIQAQDFVDQVKPLSAKQRQETNDLFVKKMKVTGSVPKEYKELIKKNILIVMVMVVMVVMSMPLFRK